MAGNLVAVFVVVVLQSLFLDISDAVPETGIKTMRFSKDVNALWFSKSLFKNAKVFIKGEYVNTTKRKHAIPLQLSWGLFISECAQFFSQVSAEDLHLSANSDGSLASGHIRLTNYGPFSYIFNKMPIRKIPLKFFNGNTTAEFYKNASAVTEDLSSSSAETANQRKKRAVSPPKDNHKTSGNKEMKELLKQLDNNNKKRLSSTRRVNPKPWSKRNPTAPSGQATAKPLTTNLVKQRTSTTKFATNKPRQPTRSKPKTKAKVPGNKNLKTKAKVPDNKNLKTKPKVPANKKLKNKQIKPVGNSKGLAVITENDGNYLLIVEVISLLDDDKQVPFSVEVEVQMKSETGYLSAAEWPLLPFYGAMSLLYLAFGVVWLIVSACQWRELLRIQFWIGGVIALGMLEKAVFFSEYNNVNIDGIPAHGLVVFAQVLSCIKRTLSRILIIIVSMGFGIVKPRLGAALHRVLGVGCLYFILCVIEGAYRASTVTADVSKKVLLAAVPLSVLDAVICWWIFMALMQTMRTLRIRKNVVKLTVYRHFTNILVVSVIVSVAFMVWAIKYHHLNACIKDWKELWIDEAFWHFLFAIVLLAIMVLWRPTASNQRYAFTPLMDVGDEDDDDMTLSDAFQGMKMRGKGDQGDTAMNNRVEKSRSKEEDDLKWVEENIPTAAGIDTVLPSLLDSDEEVMTTKLEMSKME